MSKNILISFFFGAAFVFLGTIADAFGAYACRGLKLYDEDPEDESNPDSNGTSKNAILVQANKELQPMLSSSVTTSPMLTPNEEELLKTLNSAQ